MISYRVLLVSAAIAAATAATPASAQEYVYASCEPERFRDNPDNPDVRKIYNPFVTACARAAINRQVLINNGQVLSRIVAQSFEIGPTGIEPAGLGDLTAEEAVERLTGSPVFQVSPTADVPAATAAVPDWNIWVDGKYTWNDASQDNFNLDGPLLNGLAGIDYKLSPKITLGVMGSYESSNLDGTGVDSDSQGWGAGPYLGIVLTDNLVFSANFIASSIDSSQSGIFDFDSDRIQAAAALNGYWYKDTWRFTPGINLSWSKEWQQEDHNFSPDQTLETALLTPSLQIGDTLRISELTTVEPWLGTALDWTFISSIDQDGSPNVDDPSLDLRVQAGLNFAFGSNAQLALTADAGGLLLDDLNTYSGEANLAIQF